MENFNIEFFTTNTDRILCKHLSGYGLFLNVTERSFSTINALICNIRYDYKQINKITIHVTGLITVEFLSFIK